MIGSRCLNSLDSLYYFQRPYRDISFHVLYPREAGTGVDVVICRRSDQLLRQDS